MQRKSSRAESSEDQFWSMRVVDSVTVLRLEPGSIRAGMDLGKVDGFWRLFESLLASPSRVLLVDTPRNELSPGTLDRLLEYFKRTAADEFLSTERHERARLELTREEHAFQRYLRYVCDSRLFVVAACQGEIDLNLLGLVLACDYCIASDDTVIVNRGSPLGGRIGTAVPWFLTRLVGRSRAFSILLSQTTLSADSAVELGLFHRLTRAAAHENETLAIARELATQGVVHLQSIKRSLCATVAPLGSYLTALGAGFDGRILDAPRCGHCGYNLTGNVSGRCPECGCATRFWQGGTHDQAVT